MARLTRKELKTDTVSTSLTEFTEFFLSHGRKIALAGAGVALLVAGIWGGGFYLRRQQTQAAEAFGQALTTYHAAVTPTPPAGATAPTFKTGKEKYEEAQKQFLAVAAQFPRSSPGRWARLYVALCQRDLDNLPEAEKELSSLAKESDPELAAQAKMALAGVFLQTGRRDDAIKLYEELLQGRPTTLLPRATIQLALAALYQQTNPSRAMEIYQQMAKEYSGTAIGDVVNDMLKNSRQ